MTKLTVDFELNKLDAQIACAVFVSIFAGLFLSASLPFAILLLISTFSSAIVYGAICRTSADKKPRQSAVAKCDH